MPYRLAPQAEADIEDIAFYVFPDSGSLEIADRLVHSITERFELLGAYPRAVRTRDDLQPGLRGFPVGEYVLLYRVEEAAVVILRVVRGRRPRVALA